MLLVDLGHVGNSWAQGEADARVGSAMRAVRPREKGQQGDQAVTGTRAADVW